MAGISCRRGGKRKLSARVKAAEPDARSSRVIFLSPSHLLFEIPPNINTSLPVWEAMRAEQADITWSLNPYSLSINVTPVTSKQRRRTTPSKSVSSSCMVQTPLSTSILQLQLVFQPINQQPDTSQNQSSVQLASPQDTQSVSCTPDTSQNQSSVQLASPQDTQSVSCTPDTSQNQSSVQLASPQDTQSVSCTPDTSQNQSSVLLTSPQDPQSVSGAPNPSPEPATSLSVSFPIIITQAQPAQQVSIRIKQEPIDPTQSPKKPCIKQPTKILPKAPLRFHTRSCSTVHICDDFLFGFCDAEEACKMHHTPYPFHWQLWCVAAHQWVDISPSSQVLLERLYCDVNQEAICLKNGIARYTLNFDSMDLDDSSVYDGVRRLSNTHSQIMNPHFASELKFYWWNVSWQEYSENLSAAFEKKIVEKERECYFNIGLQQYKVDFIVMIQTNMTTGFQRAVRWRPVYRSLDSMKPYLQTRVLPDSTEPDCHPPGPNFSVDPLQEFSSWYPPVWSQASGRDYSLVDVPAGTLAYRRIQEFFYETLPETRVDIIGIQQIQNLLCWDKYQRHKVYMQKRHGRSSVPLERHLFHGTTKEASEDICCNNFDPRVSGVHGVSHGFGTYFASSASVSNMFATKFGPDEVHHMFLAKVLVGRFTLGRSNYRRPPQIASRAKQRRLYDACVDNINAPNVFVVYDGCQCYPYYLIKYKDLRREVDI